MQRSERRRNGQLKLVFCNDSESAINSSWELFPLDSWGFSELCSIFLSSTSNTNDLRILNFKYAFENNWVSWHGLEPQKLAAKWEKFCNLLLLVGCYEPITLLTMPPMMLLRTKFPSFITALGSCRFASQSWLWYWNFFVFVSLFHAQMFTARSDDSPCVQQLTQRSLRNRNIQITKQEFDIFFNYLLQFSLELILYENKQQATNTNIIALNSGSGRWNCLSILVECRNQYQYSTEFTESFWLTPPNDPSIR